MAKLTSRPLARHLGHAMALALAMEAGCAVNFSPQEGAMDCRPIDLAMDTPTEQLQLRAQQGEPQSQYALSIVLAYGLRGKAADESQAKVWRTRALAVRGTMQQLNYVPGLRGQPGGVLSAILPASGISAAQQVALSGCLALLNSGQPTGSPEGISSCGGLDNFHRLAAAWIRARAPGAGAD